MALVAALGMAGASISFEIAGKKVGSLTVNIVRLVQGMIFLSITSFYVRGLPLPTDASLKEYTFLGISGFIGMFLGDLFMFESFVLLGARITTLIMTTVPVVTALSAWILLGETLSFQEGTAVFLTIGGIFLVMFNGNGKGEKKEKFPIKGMFCAIGGVLGQSLGMVFSKIGLESYDPIAATQIRIIVATIAFIILISVRGKWGEIKNGIKNKKAFRWLVVGSFFGPFVGVTAMLIALKNASAGIVSTLSSTSPILVIPFCILIFKERVRPIEILGAVISVGGASLFFI
ncbi:MULTISPECIES: DMT family transporter [Psychrilyobacter]|uniref:EamA family transporter n=1 Tax=Psychrilyobacter piezotolerans TaxID=2293438 RepID=A0ABX9KJG2_9FUSO|nr:MULTISPECIES: DMT family transporter [Psychrilyobacter]MCS5421812.1 DMT family transporter [Psychrilyobacter sp. S5]NDI77044.1 DMT family transporter [Psychrilyobacter piezotolerans]RDE64661.1 EamA family transporter [Psychrilyobacter sp. S5]REI42473.1 EamA family transporter [Psychrilyobacter piezotolerans]